jgi:hypothetical protein
VRSKYRTCPDNSDKQIVGLSFAIDADVALSWLLDLRDEMVL